MIRLFCVVIVIATCVRVTAEPCVIEYMSKANGSSVVMYVDTRVCMIKKDDTKYERYNTSDAVVKIKTVSVINNDVKEVEYKRDDEYVKEIQGKSIVFEKNSKALQIDETSGNRIICPLSECISTLIHIDCKVNSVLIFGDKINVNDVCSDVTQTHKAELYVLGQNSEMKNRNYIYVVRDKEYGSVSYSIMRIERAHMDMKQTIIGIYASNNKMTMEDIKSKMKSEYVIGRELVTDIE